MKHSFFFLAIFALGLLIGGLHLFRDVVLLENVINYILYAMMIVVGISIGSDPHLSGHFKWRNLHLLLVPFSVILGTALGMCLYHLFFKFPDILNLFAIGCGMGYYSLSSILITKVSGNTIGMIALLANIFRELTTFVIAPFLAKYIDKMGPVASAGATSSDTTLPVIMKYSGKDYVLISVLNGIVITLLVPVMIALIYGLF